MRCNEFKATLASATMSKRLPSNSSTSLRAPHSSRASSHSRSRHSWYSSSSPPPESWCILVIVRRCVCVCARARVCSMYVDILPQLNLSHALFFCLVLRTSVPLGRFCSVLRKKKLKTKPAFRCWSSSPSACASAITAHRQMAARVDMWLRT